jgi:hypothetical protein
MSVQKVTDAGDINKNFAAEVQLEFNGLRVEPGADGIDCPGFDYTQCSGAKIIRSAGRIAPPSLVLQPNDLSYNVFDIWIDVATGCTWVLLNDDYSQDPACATTEGYDTDLATCVPLISGEDTNEYRRRVWRPLTFSYMPSKQKADGGAI